MSDPPAQECAQPADCRPGDWVAAGAVPDWPIGDRLHSYEFPRDPQSPGVPEHPALAMLFEQGSHTDGERREKVIWVRKE